MRPADIESQLKLRPFVPFFLHLSDGTAYQIRHPEMLMVTRSVLGVAVYDDPDSERPARLIMCDPVHVTRLEPINGHLDQSKKNK